MRTDTAEIAVIDGYPIYDAPTDELWALTAPLAEIQARCGWCDVRLTALPHDPPREFEGRWYHPGGCIQAARFNHYGLVGEKLRPWGS
jgi:hypothetical protein